MPNVPNALSSAQSVTRRRVSFLARLDLWHENAHPRSRNAWPAAYRVELVAVACAFWSKPDSATLKSDDPAVNLSPTKLGPVHNLRNIVILPSNVHRRLSESHSNPTEPNALFMGAYTRRAAAMWTGRRCVPKKKVILRITRLWSFLY